MTSVRGMVSGGLTRRALVLAAPSLLVPTVVLAAVAPTPGASEVRAQSTSAATASCPWGHSESSEGRVAPVPP